MGVGRCLYSGDPVASSMVPPTVNLASDMLVFAHTHKCAGSAILDLCRRTESVHFVEDARRLAGMPALFYGAQRMKYTSEFQAMFTKDRLESLIEKYQAEGKNFFAVEWGLPPFHEMSPGVAKTFTVVRDPLSRYLSNYFFDLERGYSSATTFEAYQQQGRAFRQPDYYTRFFGGMANSDMRPPDGRVIERSFVALRAFDAVLLQEDPESFVQLDQFDLDAAQLARRNSTKSKLEVSDEFVERFMERAALDYELYNEAVRICKSAMARRGRSSDAPAASGSTQVGKKPGNDSVASGH